jgi:hypothetical protein
MRLLLYFEVHDDEGLRLGLAQPPSLLYLPPRNDRRDDED